MYGHMMIYASAAPRAREKARFRPLPDDFVCLTTQQQDAARRLPGAAA